MTVDGYIEGRYVNLRSVEEYDAEYTLSLRQNPELNKYFPHLNITLEQQKAWICKQRQQEGDYYFIVEDKDGNKVGVVGIYNVNGDTVESGRVIVVGNAIHSIESQMLSFEFAFDKLNAKRITHYVYADNTKALRSAMMFGSVFTEPHLDEHGIMVRDGVITLENYLKSKEKLDKIIYRR